MFERLKEIVEGETLIYPATIVDTLSPAPAPVIPDDLPYSESMRSFIALW